MSLIGRGRAHIVMNFAARAAGAGIAHGPEVFLQAGDGNDAVARRAGTHPQVQGLFVGAQDISGRDLRSAEHRKVELIEGIPNHLGEVISSQANAMASFLK